MRRKVSSIKWEERWPHLGHIYFRIVRNYSHSAKQGIILYMVIYFVAWFWNLYYQSKMFHFFKTLFKHSSPSASLMSGCRVLVSQEPFHLGRKCACKEQLLPGSLEAGALAGGFWGGMWGVESWRYIVKGLLSSQNRNSPKGSCKFWQKLLLAGRNQPKGLVSTKPGFVSAWNSRTTFFELFEQCFGRY